MGVRFCGVAVACVVFGACQRLEIESDGPSDDGFDADGFDDDSWSPPPADSDSDSEPDPDPPVQACVYRTECECYGGTDNSQLCDVVMRQRGCTSVLACREFEGAEWEQCQIDAHCDAGGRVEGTDVICDDTPTDCAGTCDVAPSLCDADGDGVPMFDCGWNGLQCAFGQFCVARTLQWDCDLECDSCNGSPAETHACVDAPAECEGIPRAGGCVHNDWCEYSWGTQFSGHFVECDRGECMGF